MQCCFLSSFYPLVTEYFPPTRAMLTVPPLRAPRILFLSHRHRKHFAEGAVAFPRWEAEQREGGCVRCLECEGAAVCCEVTELGQAAQGLCSLLLWKYPNPWDLGVTLLGWGWTRILQSSLPTLAIELSEMVQWRTW